MTPGFLPGKRTMKLRIGTGPMGVSAVKVSSSSWSWCALEMAAQKLLGFDVPGAGGPARANGDELARVLKRLCAVEVLLGLRRQRRQTGCRPAAAFFQS